MANYSRGNITVPYKRGTGSTLKGSEALNRSYRVDLTGDEAVLASAASYAPYVVGDQQADIHKGRWNTAANAVQTIQGNGSLDALVAQAMEKL
jgi:tetraacyldisaccharide-1-P 4'-kinase